MSPAVTILLVGLAYAVFVGGLSLLRREGLSGQFALEAAVITAVVSALARLTAFSVHPVLFLIGLYLVTMRVRLLVDLGNAFAQRGAFAPAGRCYDWALQLWPDKTGRLVVQVNRATACLQQGALDEALAIFKEVLQQAGQGYLGVKYEAAAHYHLGLVYRRKGLEAQAIAAFNAAVDTWPASEYARRAQAALEYSRRKQDDAI